MHIFMHINIYMYTYHTHKYIVIVNILNQLTSLYNRDG